MATKAKLHGRPLHLTHEINRMYDKPRDPGESRRAWGKRVAELVYELATQCNVDPQHLASLLPPTIVDGIIRERIRAKLAFCGVTPVAPAHVTPIPPIHHRGKNGRLAVAA